MKVRKGKLRAQRRHRLFEKRNRFLFQHCVKQLLNKNTSYFVTKSVKIERLNYFIITIDFCFAK